MRPLRIRRTDAHLKAILHYPQRQPGELVRSAPPDIPPWLSRYSQSLGYQGRLANAWLALDPYHRSFATGQGFHSSTENRKLIISANPVRGPNRPHSRNCASTFRRRCLVRFQNGVKVPESPTPPVSAA